jgi:hypothetical protein
MRLMCWSPALGEQCDHHGHISGVWAETSGAAECEGPTVEGEA